MLCPLYTLTKQEISRHYLELCVSYSEIIFIKSMNVCFLPPVALYNNPCSNHCHQRVECVDMTGSDGNREAQKQSRPLLHRRT